MTCNDSSFSTSSSEEIVITEVKSREIKQMIPQGSFRRRKWRNQQSSKRLVALVLGISTLAAVAFGVYAFLNHNGIQFSGNAPTRPTTVVSREEVSSNNVPESCWLVLHGNVYDLTEYEHPAGNHFIHHRCGKDATQSFDAVHSSRAYLPQIARFSLGRVEQGEEETFSPTRSPSIRASSLPQPALAPSLPPSSAPRITKPDPKTGGLAFPSVAEDLALLAQSFHEQTPSCISMDQVEKHSDRDDCHMVLYNHVFDFTVYVELHPGGDYFTRFCGTNATDQYELFERHTEQLLLEDGVFEYRLGDACSEAFVDPVVHDNGPPTSPRDDGPNKTCISMDQVEEHSERDDCYMVLYDHAFDFTAYVDLHPGGDYFTRFCGTNATDQYEMFDRHTEQLLINEGAFEYRLGDACSAALIDSPSNNN